LTSTFFTISGNRIGSVNVNRIRLLMAAVFLSLTSYFTTGSLIPVEANAERWFWLGLSGLVGFVIGDAMLFEAFVVVGNRISMLLMSLVPIMSALFAWIALGETLDLVEITAIIITVGGIVWVVADKNRDKTWVKGRRLAWGITLGIGGALGQAFGLILSKKGLEGGYSALSGNLIRVLVALVAIWLITLVKGNIYRTLSSLKDKRAIQTLLAGSFFGPFLGVWLSLVSIKYARIGIASTLMATTPIILIPLAHWIFKDRVTIGSIIGTIVAVAGVALLIMSAN
jgi:drug/metabolite transporter (DMT)-like permease